MALETNFENFEVNTIIQVRDLILKRIEDIMLSTITGNLWEDSFTEDVIGVFRKKAVILAGIIGGSAAVIAGAGVATVGALLIPLTLGGSIALLASGAAIGALGATVSVGISVDSLIKDNKMKEPVKKALVQLCFLEKEIVTLVVIANITYRIISAVGKEPKSSEKGMLVENASTLRSNADERLSSCFKDLTEQQKGLHNCHTLSDLGKQLYNLADTLKRMCMSITDDWTEFVDVEAHNTIETAFTHPFDYLFQIPESQFIYTLMKKATVEKNSILAFWLKHFEVRLEGKGESRREDKLPTNTTLNENKVLVPKPSSARVNITSLYFDETSKEFGQKMLRFVRAVSAAKLIIESSVSGEDFEFLGNSNFDFLKKDSEDWPSAFENISDLMMDVRESLKFCQYDDSANLLETRATSSKTIYSTVL